MRILLAPRAFRGTLTAGEAADAIATGWRQQAPGDALERCPLSDGGPGFLEALSATVAGDLLSVTVPGPFGADVPATVLVAGTTAYVESAQACGLHLVPADARDAARASSAGVGVLVRAAVQAGARRVVVGVGGAATADGGAGMLAELGAGSPAALGRGGAALDTLDDSALAGLPAARAALTGVDLVAATDVALPLLGFGGAAANLPEEHGVSPEEAQRLDRALGRYAQVALDTLGPEAAPQRLVAEAGAGAGGGLGFGLLLLGARREIGVSAVLEAVGFAARLQRNDLVLTGEGTLDWRSLRGGVVAGVAAAALDVGVPTVVLAGEVHVGRRELLSIGVESAYPVAEGPEQARHALADPAGTLAERSRRVARTWSRSS